MTDDSRFEPATGPSREQMNPKELFLCSAATCAALTALSIMKRQRIAPVNFEVTVSGRLSTDEVRAESVYESFEVFYRVETRNDDDDARVGRAIILAHDKYCGLVRMLKMIGPVSRGISAVVSVPAASMP